MHDNMWEVFRLVFVCLDAMGKDSTQDAKARSLVGKLLADIARFATAEGSADAARTDSATCTLDELREACNHLKESSLQYINSLTDEQILHNPTGGVEDSIFFCLSHAAFASAWRIGQLHLMLGIEELETIEPEN